MKRTGAAARPATVLPRCLSESSSRPASPHPSPRRLRREMVATVPCVEAVQGLTQGARGRHPAREHPGVRVLEGLRQGVPADAHVLQPRHAHLPLPPTADQLQPRRRAWTPQDPHLQGLAPPPCPPMKGMPASGNSMANALYISENNSRCSHYVIQRTLHVT